MLQSLHRPELKLEPYGDIGKYADGGIYDGLHCVIPELCPDLRPYRCCSINSIFIVRQVLIQCSSDRISYLC